MFEFDVLKVKDSQTTEMLGIKNFYNLDETQSLTNWVKEMLYKPKDNSLPVFSSFNSTKPITKNFGDSIGYCYFTANRVEYNQRYVCVLSTPFSISRGFYINKENFGRFLVAFSSRCLINSNWLNEKDEYSAPNTTHEIFNSFQNDSLVISLFSNNSGQASYKNFQHLNNNYNIKNEFFWMSVEKMKELADQNGYDELYNDARTSSDRYIHKLLFGEERVYDKLSPDAKAVLDKATELVEKSMELRQVMANDENHLNSWDAGYAQLKLVWKEYFQEEFKEFRQLYKALEDRMRPLVYELGFLKK
jgi:hypothetical protein